MNLAMSDNEDGNEDNDDSDSDMVEVTHEDNEAAKDELSVSKFKEYRKVASSILSLLVAHLRIFKLFMKGKFDAYVL